MTHRYPFGAIENEGPLLFGLMGQTLYGVHGLGPSSFTTVMSNVRNLTTNTSGFRCIEYDVNRPKDTLRSGCCLGDFNIGAHHNAHYIFHNREDADAYLAWAKENTQSYPSKSKWQDGYKKYS